MRHFVNVTWNNAAENYDGTQQQNHHFNPNGSAAIHNYSDDVLAKRPKQELPIASKILSQNVTLNRLDRQQAELDKAYADNKVSIDEYEELLYVLNSKRDKAYKSLCKELGKPLEDGAIGELRDGSENVSDSLKTQENSYFLLNAGQGIEKNVKDDFIFFLLGAVICFSLLLWITN